MKYVLIIYVIISIANIVLFELNMLSMINYAKRELKKNNIKTGNSKISISEHMLPHLKALLMCLLPIFNVVMLLAMLFKGNVFLEEADKVVKHQKEVNDSGSLATTGSDRTNG